MKILSVTPYYWPAFSYGGPVFSLHYLNKALVKKGIDVTVYTTNAGLDKNIPGESMANVDGVKVTYFKFSKLFEFITKSELMVSLPMGLALKRNLKYFDIVYIATAWSYSSVVAAVYCRLYKKPYIFSPRGMLYPDVFYKKAWKKRPYYRLVVKRALEGASSIHYTSKDEAEKTHSFLGLKNKKIIISNGIELFAFTGLIGKERLLVRYPNLKNKKVILFLGRINWKKGLDILIEGFARLFKDRQDVHLLIAGNDKEGYIRRVKKWIRNYGVDCRVTFTGMLNEKDKLEAYSGSDIFVLPSYSENFGLSVVEAMALGLPVVISNKVGISKEIAINKSGVVVNTDAESLYRGMKLLLGDAHLKEEIIINGKKMVEGNYNIDKVADKMIEAFENIVKLQNDYSRNK